MRSLDTASARRLAQAWLMLAKRPRSTVIVLYMSALEVDSMTHDAARVIITTLDINFCNTS